jgi:proteic killer suppression protein
MLRAAANLQEVRNLPGLRCHQLLGERAGQWALNLDEFHRLIFTVVDRRMEVICVEEVSKHYGD